MSFTKIRRTIALVLLGLLLVATTWTAIDTKRTGYFTLLEWIHVFCLAQTILLAAWAVYGPGRLGLRLPFVIACGLTLGFALARSNLISTAGRVSVAAGAILVVAGMLPSLTLFVVHRWRTGAMLSRNAASVHRATPQGRQLSLRMLMVMMTAFAVTAFAARTAVTAPPDPFGNEHDKFVMHAWLAFFPCLASAPALLVVFRPSWKIALTACFFILLAFVEPIAFALSAPLIFEDKKLALGLTEAWSWKNIQQTLISSVFWHGQTLVATVVYALLARAAGFQMIFPFQSNDKKPNPSGQPATDAGCVQD